MKRRFLLHALSHTVLVVDISEIGLPSEVYPREGKRQDVASLRFKSWKDAEQYLEDSGARREVLGKASTELVKTGLAVATIA